MGAGLKSAPPPPSRGRSMRPAGDEASQQCRRSVSQCRHQYRHPSAIQSVSAAISQSISQPVSNAMQSVSQQVKRSPIEVRQKPTNRPCEQFRFRDVECRADVTQFAQLGA